MIHLTINERPVEVLEGCTILEACQEHGFSIPTLCYHPALKPYGGCRLCMVEISQPPRPPRLVASCTYPCEENIQVLTTTPKVLQSRRITAELLLATAWDSPEIQSIAEELGVGEVRYRLPDSELCVLCGLCVRACEEIVGVSSISFAHRGMQKKVGPPLQKASGVCIACGTCTLICPTGAIHLSDITGFSEFPGVHNAFTELPGLDCQICNDLNLSVQFNQELASLALLSRHHVLSRGG